MSSSRSALLLCGLALTFALGSSLPTTTDAGNLQPLPESLGQWYKPQNKRQVWLHTMFALRRELQAVTEYAELADTTHLSKWAGQLDKHYRSIAEMVPEWTDELDLELIAGLSDAAHHGDFAGVLEHARKLEHDCTTCHRQYQALAALRYRWPDFRDIRVPSQPEPGAGESIAAIDYREHMQILSTSINRIKIASSDDRWDDADVALTRLRIQLSELGTTCKECHQEPQPHERVLGQAAENTLTELAHSLDAKDLRASGRMLGEAAVQICAHCHSIHRLTSGIRHQIFD